MSEKIEFIIQPLNGENYSSETRTRIRRQAMKAVGEARRKRGNYGQHNLRQHILLFKNDEHDKEQDPLSIAERSFCTTRRVPGSMPLSGLDSMISDCGLHVLDLSALTVVTVGQAAGALLASQPSLLGNVLGCPQWSYFSYLSSRYGFWKCLDDSLYCLLFKAREVLLPCPPPSGLPVFRRYGRALRSLQAAIDDPNSWAEPEVLCATALLAMFEMFNSSSPQAWSNHIRGASRLIKLRGPKMYTTDFEKALLIGLSGALVAQALQDNHACFLEQEPWQNVLDSAIDPVGHMTERSALSVSLLKLLVSMPGIFAEVTDFVCRSGVSDARRRDLIDKTRRFRRNLMQWKSAYDGQILKGDNAPSRPAAYDKRVELLGTSLLLRIIAGRLLGAVSPSDRPMLEDEVLCFAKQLYVLRNEASSINSRAGFYLSQKSNIPDATLQTSALWEDTAATRGKMIEPWRFQHWCDLIPRKTTGPQTRLEVLPDAN